MDKFIRYCPFYKASIILQNKKSTMEHTMKSWQIDAIGIDNLELRNVAVPKPQKGEILVKVAAISLNYRDKMVIETGRGLELSFPFSPGSDLSGTVIEVGEGANHFNVGDKVITTASPDWIDGLRPGNAKFPFYRTLGGYYSGVMSEYVAFSEDWFVRAPVSLDPTEASTPFKFYLLHLWVAY